MGNASGKPGRALPELRFRLCIRLCIGLCIGLCVCPSTAVQAAHCGPYRVGLREYPQFYERKPDGRFDGLDREFFIALAERSGCRLSLELESQPRLWARVRDGTLDMASWVVPNEERRPLVHVIPLLSSRLMAVTWRERGELSQSAFLADTRLRAVAIRKAVYGPGYDALLTQLRLQGRLSEVADFDTALRAFTARRVDLLIAYPWTLPGEPRAWLDRVRLTDWQPEAPAIAFGLALSRSTVREADLRQLRQGLDAMREDGSLARLVRRYLPDSNVQLLPAGPPR